MSKAKKMTKTKRPEIAEKDRELTAKQIGPGVVMLWGGEKLPGMGPLVNPLPASYDTYRRIRQHPTIALAMSLMMAPIVAAEWSIEEDEDAPEGARELIEKCFLPVREPLIEASLVGGITFGWQGFEKVWAVEDRVLTVRKFKPLLQDMTEILIEQQTGKFAGFRQGRVKLPVENSLLINFRVEGTQWHGQSLLENARDVVNQWREANAGAARYDRKMAGTMLIGYFPTGSERDSGGALKPNSEIAQDCLRTLLTAGSIAVPQVALAHAENLTGMPGDIYQWKFEILEDKGGRQPLFIARLSYLDTQMVRALLMPERAMLEAEHGTKAEAGEHIELALTNAELTHRHITRLINWHAVDQVLALNYDDECRGKVRLVAAPIVDVKLAMLKHIYTTVLQNPSGLMEEYEAIDWQAVKDTLGIPSVPVEENGADAEQKGAKVPEGMDINSPLGQMVRKLYRDLGSAKDTKNQVAEGD